MSSKIICLFLFFLCNLVQAFGYENSMDRAKPENLCRMKVDLSDISFQADGMYYILKDGYSGFNRDHFFLSKTYQDAISRITALDYNAFGGPP